MKECYKTIILVIFIIIGIFSIIEKEKQNKKDKISAQKLSDEFPFIETSQEYYFKKVEGVVISKKLDMGRYNKGALYLTLKNGFKFSIAYSNNNYSYYPSELVDFIQINDSILKPAESNIFYVFRNNQKYIFVLGHDIKKE